MAHLQCIDAVKKRSRNPSAKCITAIADSDVHTSLTLKKPKIDRTLYDIEIIDEDGPHVRVHYVGYDKKYDEWKLRSEIVMKKPPEGESINYSPFVELVGNIKRKLKAMRSDDLALRIQVCPLYVLPLL